MLEPKLSFTPSRRTLGLLSAMVAALGALHVVRYIGPFEDAFITYRYVENLLEGHGPVYNPGERVEGASSLGWVFVLALVASTGLPLPTAATLLSVVAGGGLLVVTVRLGERLLGKHRHLAPLAAAWVAANGTWAYFSGTGMETAAFALTVNAALVSLLGEQGSASAKAVGSGALLALAACLRPEGLGYAGAFAAALLTARAFRSAALFTLAGIALFLPFFAWRYSYYGFLLPNTYYAKASPSWELLQRGGAHLEQYLTWQLSWFAPATLLVWLRRSPSGPKAALVTWVSVATAVNVVVVGGDTFAFYRFVLPAMPLVGVALAAAVGEFSTRTQRRSMQVAGLLVAAVACGWTVLGGMLPRTSLTARNLPAFSVLVDNVARINRDFFVVGRWLALRFPPGTTMAINAAGIVPYESKLRALDMLGLNDVHIAHKSTVLGAGVHGHEKHDAAYVLGREPDIIFPGLPVLSSRRLSPEEVLYWSQRWSAALPGDRALISDPRFAAEYVPRSEPAADHGYVNYFVRRSFSPKRP